MERTNRDMASALKEKDKELTSMDNLDTSSSKNINMKQYIGVIRSLPKTRLNNTIMYENTSHDRHLEMKLKSLEYRREKTLEAFDISKKAFMKQQAKKRKKWMREDEIRLSSLNLPILTSTSGERQPSAKVVYRCIVSSPEKGAIAAKRKPVLPMLKIHRERTEIVTHHDKTFLTHMPSYVEIDHSIEKMFDDYRGKNLLSRGYPCKDERFTQLQTLLQSQPRKKRAWEIF